MEISKTTYLNRIKEYEQIIFVFFASIVIYILTAIYNDVFLDFISVTGFLTWHTIFEFASILVSFSIFTVTYFVYGEHGKLRMIIFGCAFLIMALLDTFHTLSYEGMADFLIVNNASDRTTTLWILSRIVGTLGIMISMFIPSDIISSIKKKYFILISAIFSILILLATTYYPNLFPIMFVKGEGLTSIKLFLEYIVILILMITFIVVSIEYQKTKSNIEYRFMIAIVLLIFSELAFTNYGSIYDAFNYVGHFFKVLGFIVLYRSIYIVNLTAPYRELKKTKNELKEYSDGLDILVKQRTEELENLNKVLITDIEYAKEVQTCLLPAEMPKNMSVSFDAKFYIAEHLSGDFYNVIKLDEENIALYIGDVSGHGVAAAMLTVFANQNVIQLKESENESSEIIEPGYVLKTIYKSFNKTNISAEKYILMLYGIYNTKTKCFTYSSAGINVPPYIIKQSGEVIEMDVKGLPICKLGDFIDPFYTNENIKLESGDKVLFYSDGLVEATNKSGEVYGQDRLIDLLEKNYKLNSSQLNNVIKDDFFNYMGYGEKLMDDTTLLIMEITN